MRVDSFAYLPRSFRPMFEAATPHPDEQDEVFAPLDLRLADARIALLTSSGMYVRGDQEPFDLDQERQNPNWGDPGHRMIPHDTPPESLGVAHLHINTDDLLEDRDVALPVDVLDGLVDDGIVGGAAEGHVSVMGFQGWKDDALANWRRDLRPHVIDALRGVEADGVVLAPV